MKMQERIKMRSVSFSDEAPAAVAPVLPPRSHRSGGTYRRQTSAESLPLYETEPIYGNNAMAADNHRLNSLPRIMPHHRRKILDFNRPSSSLAGHYNYLGSENNAPDYANLTSISRRGAEYYRSKDTSEYSDYGFANTETDHYRQQPSYLLTAPTNNEDAAALGSNSIPYSPSGYGDTAAYNSLPRNTTGTTTNSILKNGSLRSRRGNGYYEQTPPSTVLRPMKYGQQNYNNGYNMDYDNSFSNSHYSTAGSGGGGGYNNAENNFVYEHDYSNGNIVNSNLNSTMEDDQLNARLKKKASDTNITSVVDKVNSQAGNTSNNSNREDTYPVMSKPSPSLQIIATRNRPCCECIRYNQRAPLCLLFIIFAIASCSLITGVMFYLKSDSHPIKSAPIDVNSQLNAQTTRNGGCDPDSNEVCPHGGVCIDGRCHCEDTCPYTQNPVCGNDGKTYDNECLLKLAGCRRRSPISIRHRGECGHHDPCEELSCPKYAKCVPSFDGASASCVCPEPCSNDPVDESSVVCGSNGQDYPSRCHLERAACEHRWADLDVRYQGKCNPCQGFECQSPQQECQVEEQSRSPICNCDQDCANETAPICASNGKTYRNECLMKLDACRKKVDLRVIYPGLCNTGLNQCKLLSCNFGQECEIDKQGITNCVCNQRCQPIVRPVCANDGNTYNNLCEMQKYGCQNRLNLDAKYFGTCDSNGPCSKRSCNHHSICVESGDLAFCECPECTEEYDPVCGGDGVTYDNGCKLRREACLKETDINIVENAPCSGCANISCEFYSVCKSQGIGQPGICVCPTDCIEEDQDVVIVESEGKKVCGTDGQTYPSLCHMKIAACKKQQYIVVANKGDCDVCRGVNCKHGAHCQEGVCVCPTNCPATDETLCATDMNTYRNECEMLKAACERNMALSFLHHGPCAGLEKKYSDNSPCFGELPLLNTATGLEYNCGIYGVQCPANSFCHQTSTFAKCCPKALEDCSKFHRECCDTNVDQDFKDDPAAGSGQVHAGCPLHCHCNPLGSATTTFCDRHLCTCFPGIGGFKCDRCLPGFWGMPRSKENAHLGCKLCNCSPHGSVRSDCEQMSGRCVCKPGISGDKCDTCPDGSIVTQRGCEGLYFPFDGAVERCGNETCQFGARCKHNQVDGSLKCSCDFFCDQEPNEPVCGSDGNSYRSQCELQWRSCHLKSHILITEFAPCKSFSYFDAYLTEPPLLFHTDDGVVMKSTRHTGNMANNMLSPTPSTILVHGLLGEVCISDSDCSILNSHCEPTFKRCACKPDTIAAEQGKVCKSSSEHRVIPPTVLISETSPCFPNPCDGGGTCEEHDNTFTCFCPSDRTGDRCERRLSENDLRIPMFSGNSLVQLLPMENVEHKVSLEIDFKANSLEGILLYTQQGQDMAEGQDYLSLVLVDGHVEFRYDLGTGPAVIRTVRRIRLGHWHRIQAKRWHRDGMLKLDDYDSVDGHSKGTLRSLDIDQPTYIGGLPHPDERGAKLGNLTKIAINLGLSKLSGLHGCIKRFKLGHREVKIQSASEPLALRRVSLNECQDSMSTNHTDPCNHQPCFHGGTCRPSMTLEQPYQCTCQNGYRGHRCQHLTSNNYYSNDISAQPVSAFVPAFSNALQRPNSLSASQPSFLELPTLSHVSKAFHIEIWFLCQRPNGLLLYNGQHSNGNGDFLAINLVAGHVQLRYDLGSGVANLTSPEKASLGEWHSVKVTRNGPYGTLQLNTGQIVSGMSPGSLTELNLEMPLYLGGYRFAYNLNKDAGVVTGLDGALQRLIVNGNAIEDLIEVAKDSRGISRYVGRPCDQEEDQENHDDFGRRKVAASENKCMNGGICTPFFRSYVCKCKADFIGPKCEKNVNAVNEKSAVKLDGKTFLKFTNKMNKIIDVTEEVWVDEFDVEDEALFGPADNLLEEADTEEDDIDIYGRRGEKRNKFVLNIRTTSRNGLLIWMNQGPTLQGDFLAVAVIEGKVELSFNLGKQTQPIRISSTVRVDDGQWHRIRVLRKRRIGVLQVDKTRPYRGKSEAGASILNTDGKIWIGGKHSLPSGLPSQYYHGYIGCLRHVKVFRRKLDLLRNGDNFNLKLCNEN